MTQRTLILLATLGSAALLLGAFGFQHIGGLLPCKMCLWQRWPHAAAVIIGVAALALRQASLAWLGALAAATTGAIGVYHAGVEWRFWPGPSSCSGGGLDMGGMTGGDLLSTEGPVAMVMCDEVVWSMLGLSMAGWNAAISFALAALWIAAARART
ncbi:disulfide bond formation protein B [uncultured Sulfitobacter sp.]|uniref:disulfide bond formation protein B n=1 Tax=uncultured Sulfitobacter sp. TaxID=191468 RepID=UPI00263017CB|nr:disulfide bond formation protein B [uncultured Sulfitobacter sp.]